MSEENVEVVRRAYEAFGSSDFETLFDLLDERIVCHRWPPFPIGHYHGHEGLIELSTEWSEDFEEWTVEAEENFDFGDQVLSRIHQRALGAGSRVPVEAQHWQLSSLRNGKITQMDLYTTEQEARDALEAAGLSE